MIVIRTVVFVFGVLFGLAGLLLCLFPIAVGLFIVYVLVAAMFGG